MLATIAAPRAADRLAGARRRPAPARRGGGGAAGAGGGARGAPAREPGAGGRSGRADARRAGSRRRTRCQLSLTELGIGAVLLVHLVDEPRVRAELLGRSRVARSFAIARLPRFDATGGPFTAGVGQ